MGVLSFTGAVNRMFHSVVTSYSDYLVKNGLITESEREVQEYGLTAFLVFICNYGILLLLAALTGTIAETVIFLLAYSIPRNIIGGWHAKTPFLCAICGIVMWAVVMIFYHHLHLPKALLFMLSIACSGVLLFLVSKKDITEKRKKLGYYLIVILSIAGVVSAVYGLRFSSLILYSILCNILMNIPILS